MKRLIVSLSWLLVWAEPCLAVPPCFPWRSSNAPAVRKPEARPAEQAPVQVISQPTTAPVAPLPPKPAYPYGWFGPKPEIHFHRSFGTSKAYTQWSQE